MSQKNNTNGHYKKLYLLQDKTLEIIFSLRNSFYLTGGTALSRFYYEHRFSDDLDFFAHQSKDFSLDIKDFIAAIKDNGLTIETDVSTRDFHRYYIVHDGLKLQIDFVNDLVFRGERAIDLNSGIRIDTINEILSNKFCALIDRDEPKDVADILEISKHPEDFSLEKVLSMAKEKSNIDISLLIERLRTFPLSLLDEVSFIDKKENDQDKTKKTIKEVIDNIIMAEVKQLNKRDNEKLFFCEKTSEIPENKQNQKR